MRQLRSTFVRCRASKLCSGVYKRGSALGVVMVATILAIVGDGRRVGALRTPGARAPCASKGRAPFWVQVHAAGLAIILRVCPYLPCGAAGCACAPGAARRSNGQTTVRILVLPGFRERPEVCARASCIPMVIDTRTEMQRTAAMVASARISEAPLSGSGERGDERVL